MAADTIGDLVIRLGFDPSGLDQSASALESRLERTGTRLYFLGSRISAAFSLPLAAATGLIAKFGLEFNQAMTESLAIMDRVTPQMRSKMEAQARVISETTKFTATEAAKAYYELASAGMTAAQSVEALPVVAKFAQAGMFNLSKATEYLAGAQTALGLRTNNAAQNMQNMSRIADVLTEVNNKALGKVEDFAAALSNRGGAALKLFNKSLEEGVAVLGVYAEQNVKGRVAGNQLFMMLRDLSSAAVKVPEHFRQAGIAVFDASGKMRNIADIVKDLEVKLGPMSDQARRAELQFLNLTSRSQGALIPLIGMSDKIRQLQTNLEDAGGATQRVAEKQMQSLINQLTVIKNQFVNTAISIFNSFVPVLQTYVLPLLQKAADAFRIFGAWVEGLSEKNKLIALSFVAFGIAIGPVIIAVGGFVLTVRALLVPVSTSTALLAAMTSAYQLNAIAALEAAGATRAYATAMVSQLPAAYVTAAATSSKMAASLMTNTTAMGLAQKAMVSGSVEIGIMSRAMTYLGTAAEAVAGFFTSWLGVATIIGGVVLAVRLLVGSWTDVWNIVKAILPPLVLLESLFRAIKDGTGLLGHAISESAGTLRDFVTVGLFAAKTALMELADLGKRVTPEMVGNMGNLAYSWQKMGEASNWAREQLRGWIPDSWSVKNAVVGLADAFGVTGFVGAMKSGIDWVRNLGSALRETIPPIKDVEDHFARLLAFQNWFNRMKNNSGAMTDEQWKIIANNILDKEHGPVNLDDRGETADTTIATRRQNLFDRISGKSSLSDAADWAEGIKKLGGVSKLAEEDVLTAMRVFEDAMDRMHKAGKDRTAEAIEYGKMWMALMQLPDNPKGIAAFTPKFSPLTGPVPGLWLTTMKEMKDTEAMWDKIHKIEYSNSAVKPGMIGGITVTNREIKAGIAIVDNYGNSLKELTQIFSELGRIAGEGKFGDFMKTMSSVSALLQNAHEANMKFNGSAGVASALFAGKGSTGSEKLASAAASAAAIAQGSISVWDATSSHRSTAGNAGAGALAGAQAGAAFGPYGIAIGAAAGLIVGLVRGKPAWAQAADDVGRDFGAKISDALGKSIAARAKSEFRGSLQAASVASLKGIIEESGGITEENKTQMFARYHDIFSMLQTHQFNFAQAQTTINENWATFAAAGTDAYGRIGNELKEIIALNEKFHTQSTEIAAWFKDQGAKALGAFVDTTEGYKPEHIEDKAGLDAYGARALTSYAAAVATGTDPAEALAKLGPVLAALKAQYEKLGITIDSVGLKTLIRQSDMAKSAGGVMSAVNALGMEMAYLDNLGLENVDTFHAEQQAGYVMYVQLQAAAAATGGSTKDALLPMQDYLHQAQIEAEKLGIPLDENTQMMIDQSKELGIWKDKGKSATDVMIEGMNGLIKAVKELIDKLNGIPDVESHVTVTTSYRTDPNAPYDPNKPGPGPGSGTGDDGNDTGKPSPGPNPGPIVTLNPRLPWNGLSSTSPTVTPGNQSTEAMMQRLAASARTEITIHAVDAKSFTDLMERDGADVIVRMADFNTRSFRTRFAESMGVEPTS